jgi:hypothetical protein
VKVDMRVIMVKQFIKRLMEGEHIQVLEVLLRDMEFLLFKEVVDL